MIILFVKKVALSCNLFLIKTYNYHKPTHYTMEINKALTLSTGHLPHNEFQLLRLVERIQLPEKSIGMLRVVNHIYGYIIVVQLDAEIIEENWKDFPQLKIIIEYAIANGISYVDFDQDGPIEEEFEEFDW